MFFIKNLSGDRISIVTPYNRIFVIQAKKMGGRWDAENKAWVFDSLARNALVEAVKRIYSVDLTQPIKFVNARLTAKKEIVKKLEPVYFRGYPLASAFGRDSGARIQEGVILESGVATSGGSVKNWTTIVRKGAKFVVRGIPLDMVTNYVGDDWEVEVLESSQSEVDKKRALLEEKESLLARLAEIDKLLTA